MGPVVAIASCAIAVMGLLVAEHRPSAAGKWLCKPWASLSFVAVALASGALDTNYGRCILLGLVLCLAGDLLLIPQDRPAMFRVGVFAFLLGHVAFLAAFISRPYAAQWLVVCVFALAALLVSVWRWLAPALPAHMRRPVAAYFMVIGSMAAFACAVTAEGGTVLIASGALAFMASDVSVARDRFVQPGFGNRAWGLPLYYLAQVLLALTPASVG